MLYILITLIALQGLLQICYRSLFRDIYDHYLKNDFKRKIHLGDLTK